MNGNEYADLSISKRSLNACFSSRLAEWTTPTHVVQLILHVLRTVDLDPCSNSSVNPNIPAERFYTKAENGLNKRWEGRVFMNPPYGREISKWVHKLHEEYQDHRVTEALALLPARTDTRWFRILRMYPICFIKGRLKFGNATNSAPFPSVVAYLGTKQRTFQRVFSELGDVYKLM